MENKTFGIVVLIILSLTFIGIGQVTAAKKKERKVAVANQDQIEIASSLIWWK